MKQNVMSMVVLAGVASCSLCARAGFFDAIKDAAKGAADVVGSAANSVLSVATNQSVLSVRASTGAVETATAEQADAEQRMAMEQRNARKPKNENARLARADKNQVRSGKRSLSRGQTSGKRGSSWRQKLIDYGYDGKDVDRLDEKIRSMQEQGFSEEEIVGLLGIKDQKVAAQTAAVDAAALAKINLDDPKSLGKSDKAILDYIDEELAPRLVLKGSRYDEIKELKRQLLVQFRKTPEDTRVQSAKLAINEMIRMNGL